MCVLCFVVNVGNRLNGMIGADAVRAVTFLENHDTSHLGSTRTQKQSNRK